MTVAIPSTFPATALDPETPMRRKRRKRPANKRAFTELFVRKLKPKPTAFVTWDLKQRGLAIRVQPTGRKSWYVAYSRHGRPRWLRLGDADAIYLADARQLAAEAMLQVARGHDPAAERKAERGSGTFAELADRYLDHAKKVNKKLATRSRTDRTVCDPALGKIAGRLDYAW